MCHLECEQFLLWWNSLGEYLASYSTRGSFLSLRNFSHPSLSRIWPSRDPQELFCHAGYNSETIRLIVESTLNDCLDSLTLRINVITLSVFHRYYHGGLGWNKVNILAKSFFIYLFLDLQILNTSSLNVEPTHSPLSIIPITFRTGTFSLPIFFNYKDSSLKLH